MKCPGQDSRYWKPGAIFDVKCPKCGTMIEFFKDDTRRRCPGCGSEVPNPEMDFGCAAYCPYAEHCLGALPDGVVADGKMKVMKAKMLKALKEKDLSAGRNSALTSRFMELVEEIGKKESAPLGPLMLAAFGYGLLGLGFEGQALAGDEIDRVLQEAFSGVDAESDVAKEAADVVKGLEREESSLSLAQKVVKDAWNLAVSDYGGHESACSPDMLLTDAARQILASRQAAG